MSEPLVLLHGFTQTGAAWDAVRARLDPEREVWAPDLRGHGAAAGARPISVEALVGDVLAGAPDRFVLGGYSMGGRLALHVALAAPRRVARLVLVSATAGIEEEDERAARRRADEAQATGLEREGLEAWAERWASGPLFATAPAEAQAMRLGQDPAGLAASLRGFGAGTMPSAWSRLGELTMPVTLLAGSRDEKFSAIAERMAQGLQDASVRVVEGKGHVLPLEAPSDVARALQEGGQTRTSGPHPQEGA